MKFQKLWFISIFLNIKLHSLNKFRNFFYNDTWFQNTLTKEQKQVHHYCSVFLDENYSYWSPLLCSTAKNIKRRFGRNFFYKNLAIIDPSLQNVDVKVLNWLLQSYRRSFLTSDLPFGKLMSDFENMENSKKIIFHSAGFSELVSSSNLYEESAGVPETFRKYAELLRKGDNSKHKSPTNFHENFFSQPFFNHWFAKFCFAFKDFHPWVILFDRKFCSTS